MFGKKKREEDNFEEFEGYSSDEGYDPRFPEDSDQDGYDEADYSEEPGYEEY